MTVTISDIKRAILDGGDVAAFIPAWQKALRNPPVLVTNSLETPVSLPSPEVLLKSADERLVEVVVAWAEGKTTALTDGAPVELTAIGFAPYGHHTGAYLEHVSRGHHQATVRCGMFYGIANLFPRLIGSARDNRLAVDSTKKA